MAIAQVAWPSPSAPRPGYGSSKNPHARIGYMYPDQALGPPSQCRSAGEALRVSGQPIPRLRGFADRACSLPWLAVCLP